MDFVPDDVILQIFLSLSRVHIAKVSSVSKQFLRVSQNPQVSCSLLFKASGYDLDTSSYPFHYYNYNRNQNQGNRFPVKTGKWDSYAHFMNVSVYAKKKHSQMNVYKVLNEEGNWIGGFGSEIALPVIDSNSAKYVICEWKRSDEPDTPTPSIMNSCSFTERPRASLRIYVNVRLAEKALIAGEKLSYIDQLWEALQKSVMDDAKRNMTKLDMISRRPHVPAKLIHASKQPSGLASSITLHKYQTDCVNWMRHTESAVKSQKFMFCPYVFWRNTGATQMYNLLEAGVHASPENAPKYHCSAQGAVLADEMGLGKTLEVISLILASPQREEDIDHKDIDPKGALFHTSATLVVCPNHLLAQWEDEISKKTEPPLKVVSFGTKVQHFKVTYQDIIDADVVLISFQFLSNPNYIRIAASGKGKVRDNEGTEGKKARKTFRERIKARPGQGLSATRPLLDHFSWHRIVLDEGHEVLGEPFYPDYLAVIKTRFRWYVTGTPMPSWKVCVGLVQYLKFSSSDSEIFSLRSGTANSYNLMWLCSDIIVNNLLWRNLKETVKDNYVLPGLLEDLMMLQFTDIERLLYDESINSPETQLEICCTPQSKIMSREKFGVDNLPNLDQLKKEGTRLARARVPNLESQISKMETLIKELPDQIDKTWSKLQDLEADVENEKEISKELEEEYKKKFPNAKIGPKKRRELIEAEQAAKAKRREWEQLSDRLEKAKEELPVTRENLEAAKTFLERWEAMPPLNTQKPGLKRSSSVLSESSEVKQSQLRPLIHQFGTKLAHVITYLRTLLESDESARVIIFSQYNPFLKFLSEILEDNGIESVFVEGNVTRKTKAIEAFKSDENKVRVIMLSLSKAASGTNLMMATHVVLIDPMTGTKEEAQAHESQAIGRAYRQGQEKQVTIARFVIEDTLESDLYYRNNPVAGTKKQK
eukprot:TRINITY_DN3653_c0_g1_i2.p1 TRINITY_DN3653_c0_g1~~TRINITY_DN3653_c0_g1_i2.p1  ORF type:complete len:985 (-),score=174.06 TRINITY_DN3653_c0_g1_i2:13-2811(-)